MYAATKLSGLGRARTLALARRIRLRGLGCAGACRCKGLGDDPFSVGLDTGSSPFDVASGAGVSIDPTLSIDQLSSTLWPTYSSAGDFGPMLIPTSGGNVIAPGINESAAGGSTTSLLQQISQFFAPVASTVTGIVNARGQATAVKTAQQAAAAQVANTANIQTALLYGGGALLAIAALAAVSR